jgi:hypothetical protein
LGDILGSDNYRDNNNFYYSMTKKEIEKSMMSLINKYKKILLLDNFTFKLRDKTENENAYAECVNCYPYLNARINYNQKLIEEDKYNKLEEIVVHELCHLITDPLYNKAVSRFSAKAEIEDERERLTDYICNIVLKGG